MEVTVTALLQTTFLEAVPAEFSAIPGGVALFIDEDGAMDAFANRFDKLTRGTLKRLTSSKEFSSLKSGEGKAIAFPTGVEAEAIIAIKLGRKPSSEQARRAGTTIAKLNKNASLSVVSGPRQRVEEVVLGLALRSYEFDQYRTTADHSSRSKHKLQVFVKKPGDLERKFAPYLAQAEGVFLTRDLVSEPANTLTTMEFASRLGKLEELGVDVEVLEEKSLRKLGMRALLGVGQGSSSPSKVVVMHWKGGGDASPLALIGKGVVFDTGGISIKPAAGMEEMTMDMGGAGVVAGVMHAIAKRKANANVVGVVGLVENMVSGDAQRPGDVVRSMKGDTIEVINTDAEGRLVLADILWYAQERYNPCSLIDLATLTGAIIVALGHENAGVFSNDDTLALDLLDAAKTEGEGAWRMPLGPAYDKLLKSRIADIANVGGRAAGSITAAQFLQRFIKPGQPWAHIDIAGVAYVGKEGDLFPKGATGWGVRTLDRLIQDRFES